MAIDTRNKRASCLGIAFPFTTVWPDPDGDLDDIQDRQQMAYSYSGIESLAAYVEVVTRVAVAHLVAAKASSLSTLDGDVLVTLGGVPLVVVSGYKSIESHQQVEKQAVVHMSSAKSAELE